LALDAGELAHAAAHAGNAIAADPSLRAAYEMLDELSAAAADVHVGVRFVDAMQAFRQREVTIAISLAHLVLITPGMPSEAASLARTVIERASATEPQAAAGAQSGRRLFRRRS
jgi:hypothetical protein